MNDIFDVVLDEGAKFPVKAYPADAGFDLFSRYRTIIKANSFALFDTGVHINIKEGYVGFLKSKSGLNCKYSIVGEGVIDAGYTGSIIVKLYNHGTSNYKVEPGDKISQIVFIPIPYIMLRTAKKDDLVETERGENGFGSTGT